MGEAALYGKGTQWELPTSPARSSPFSFHSVIVCVVQINLNDAVKGAIEYTDPRTGKEYRVQGKGAIMVMRPRG